MSAPIVDLVVHVLLNLMLTFTEISETMQANRIAIKDGRFCLTHEGIPVPIRGVRNMQPAFGDEELWVTPLDPDAVHIQVKESDTITILS